ncbi:MAG: peptidoglycan DD-metalloendopeptidase family protein [Epsilonproteobacteria bacterium]|nr:peptidoglycan DD-metalloendopeptidase family protein [Campylobacterota bacterium]
MGLFKWLLTALFLIQPLSAYTLYDNRVEDKIWQSGETLLGFLQENLLPLKLYYDLDSEDEKLAADIRTNTLCHILRDENYEIKQALIPLNEELQLHISKEHNATYTMYVVPIRYQEESKELSMTLEDIFSKDIVAKTNNFPLAVELEQMFKRSLDFKRLKKGAKVVAFYSQKKRSGKFYGTQEVKAAMIQNGKQKYYLFASEDGSYYDEKGKATDTNSFIVPCKYRRISSRFTYKRWHPILKKYRAHHGIDYAGPTGTPIKAAYDGKVIFMGRKGGYGKTIVIRHKGGYKTLYAHLDRYNNRVRGAYVKKGALIGYMGNTGQSTGPHLHFGLSYRNKWINPQRKIVFKTGLSGAKKATFLKVVKAYKGKIEALLTKGS